MTEKKKISSSTWWLLLLFSSIVMSSLLVFSIRNSRQYHAKEANGDLIVHSGVFALTGSKISNIYKPFELSNDWLRVPKKGINDYRRFQAQLWIAFRGKKWIGKKNLEKNLLSLWSLAWEVDVQKENRNPKSLKLLERVLQWKSLNSQEKNSLLQFRKKLTTQVIPKDLLALVGQWKKRVLNLQKKVSKMALDKKNKEWVEKAQEQINQLTFLLNGPLKPVPAVVCPTCKVCEVCKVCPPPIVCPKEKVCPTCKECKKEKASSLPVVPKKTPASLPAILKTKRTTKASPAPLLPKKTPVVLKKSIIAPTLLPKKPTSLPVAPQK